MLPELGQVDRDAGEFWVANPFMMPAQGHNLSAFERNRLFINDGGDGFLDASALSAADIDADSRAVVPADFDRDGKIDLLVGSVGGGPLRLFLNRIPTQNRSVRVELVGTDSNRTAIGARVTLECGDTRITRDLFAANGCMGQAPAELVIGVGETERIDRLEVRWPSGRSQEFSDVPVTPTLKIIEGEPEVALAPAQP